MKKSKKDPVTGIIPSALRSKCRSALRKIWRETSRKQFLLRVRVPHEGAGRSKYDVLCVKCGKRMGFSEKALLNKVDGTPRKAKTLVYQVDHLNMNAPLLDLEADLGAYAQSLIFGAMQVLCYECHIKTTSTQRNSK